MIRTWHGGPSPRSCAWVGQNFVARTEPTTVDISGSFDNRTFTNTATAHPDPQVIPLDVPAVLAACDAFRDPLDHIRSSDTAR